MDEILLSENTDFLVIVNGTAKTGYVALRDMRNVEADFLSEYKTEYKNSRKDFIKYYKSCIIVPIEIEGSKAPDIIKKNLKGVKKRKLLLGFLCIDTMKVFETDDEISVFESTVEVAKALGDSLYIFLERVLITQLIGVENDDVKDMGD